MRKNHLHDILGNMADYTVAELSSRSQKKSPEIKFGGFCSIASTLHEFTE
jgi:hypothetical protein